MTVGGGITVECAENIGGGAWRVRYREACQNHDCRASIRWSRIYPVHPGRWLRQRRFETCYQCASRILQGFELWPGRAEAANGKEVAQGG